MNLKHLLAIIVTICTSGLANAQHISLIKPLTPRSEWLQLEESVTMNGKLYFTAKTGNTTVLWVTDGTTSGTGKVYDWPNSGQIDHGAGPFLVYNNKLFFAANDGIHGLELWSSDGTPTGTGIVKDVWPGSNSGFSAYGTNILKEMNGKLYFNGADTGFTHTIWESDGTAANTKQVVQLLPAGSGFIIPTSMEVVNGKLFFNGIIDGNEPGLWSSDGTMAGTSLVKPDLMCQGYVPFGNKLLFTAMYSSPRFGTAGLGSSDGTESGTTILNQSLATPEDAVVYKGEMVFLGGSKMFVTDGTDAGTRVVTESLDAQDYSVLITPSGKSYFPLVKNDLIYFCGKSGLWASNGTTGGEFKVKDFTQDTASILGIFPTGLTACGGQMFFKVYENNRVEIFMSDGTASGTFRVDWPGADHYYANEMVDRHLHPRQLLEEPLMVLNNELYFMAVYDSAMGKALYRLQLPSASISQSPPHPSPLVVSPNPASGIAQVRYPGQGYTSATISDISGRRLQTWAISASGKDDLNLAGLPAGTYFIRLSGTGPSISAPVVIAR